MGVAYILSRFSGEETNNYKTLNSSHQLLNATVL